MPDDPLSRSILDRTQALTHVLTRLDGTHRFALRLQAYALTLLGLALLGIGLLIWHATSGRAEHAAILQGLRADTQALQAQTDVLRHLLPRPPH